MKQYLSMIMVLCMICLFSAGCAPSGNGGSGKRSEAANIDINLPAFSNTMAYSAVVDMLTNPENHLEKTVRARGAYIVSHYTPERPYNFIVIDGPPGCCQQVLMFIWQGDQSFDYPETGERIEITGTFRSYQGFDFPYYYLAVNDITIIN